MRLVFLDTPHYHLLERVRSYDPPGYSAFLDVWHRHSCALVLTLAQESELRRYANAPRRKSRYDLVSDLAPIRTDVSFRHTSVDAPTLLHREIVGQILARGVEVGQGANLDQLSKWKDILPGRLDANQACVLHELAESPEVSELVRLEHNAVQYSATAGNLERSKANRRVRDLRAAPLAKDEASKARSAMQEAFARLQERSRFGELPPLGAGALNAASGVACEFLDRMAEIGPRAALLEYLHVTGLTGSEQIKLSGDELVARHVFQTQVRSVARDLLRASVQEEDLLARTLRFEDCPGSWLQWRLGQCVRRGSERVKPNHHFDAERLAYLPYVDLLLTDAEMAEFVRQVMADETTPGRVRQIPPARSIPHSIEALKHELESLGGAEDCEGSH